MARNKHPEVTIRRILDVSLNLFLQKGYEQTTIQDIINELGDLSKGAIYYHFKSKEDIIEAVAEDRASDARRQMEKIKATKGLTGLAKLKKLVHTALQDPMQKTLIEAVPNLLKNPRFLAEQLHSGVTEVAPIIQVFIEEGIVDGSITAKHPKELAEVLILLTNIWMNPLVFECTSEQLYQKFIFFSDATKALGIDLIEDEFFEQAEEIRKISESTKQKAKGK